jgi:hypothetical protein
MGMNFRMLPSPLLLKQSLVVNGRTYTGAPGTTIDVPDFDAGPLAANGWTKVALSGPTTARPTTLTTGGQYTAGVSSQFFDTTLGKLIVFDGAGWRDPATGNAV